MAAVSSVLTSILLFGSLLLPHGLTHPHDFSDHFLSEGPPFVTSVPISPQACWMLPHDESLAMSCLQQNSLFLPQTGSSFCFLSPSPPYVVNHPILVVLLSKYLVQVPVTSWRVMAIVLFPSCMPRRLSFLTQGGKF